jgi:hypothetical protein
MNEYVFKSSAGAMLSYLVFAPLLGALFLMAAISGWRRDIAFPMVALIAGVGLWNLAFAVRAWNKWSGVTVDLGGLHLDHGSTSHSYSWGQVKSCTPVRGVPMLGWFHQSVYQLTLTKPDRVVFFVPGPSQPRPQGLWEPHYESMLDVIRGEIAKSSGERSDAI